jgi:branched-chain amino acid transport system ATP-binding protein
MSTPLLQLQGLSVRYGSVQALSGIDLTVHQGELVTLLGSNGAGKSTTLRAISALVPASAGQILWRGGPLAAVPAHRLLKLGIGHCPEGRRVLGRQSVADNLILGAYLRRDTAGIAADLKRCYGLFPRLAERRQQLAGALSGGEQQMLAIARALMGRPELLMLDEPSLGLAPKLVGEVMRALAQLPGKASPCCLWSRTLRPHWRSPTAVTCSKPASSPCRGQARSCWPTPA